MNEQLKMSPAGLEVTKYTESFYSTSYPDPASPLGRACSHAHLKLSQYKAIAGWQNISGEPWTIGYGAIRHLDGSRVHEGETITIEDATKLLAIQIDEEGGHFVRAWTPYRQLLQREFDALTDFTYNRGAGRLRTLLHMPGDIAENMLHFDFAGDPPIHMLGLQRRRRMNRAMYLGQPWEEFKEWKP